MVLYITWLVIALTLVFLINVFCFNYEIWYSAVATFSIFTILFGLDAIIALIIHKMPSKYFQSDEKLYKVHKWEKKFYEGIGIKFWKDRIPEMGKLCNFRKDKIDNLSPEYIKKFLEETRYAEGLHIGMALIGFIILLIWPWKDLLYFSLPMAIINFTLQIPPYFVQRYNRPKLLTLYKFKTRKRAHAE